MLKLNPNIIYNLDELAAALQVGKATPVRWAKTEGLPALKLGRRWLFDGQAVINWISERQVLPA